jgi:ribosome maturation factor RimP
MVHPLVPQVQALAEPIARELGFELVHIVFHTNQHPPVLRIDIRPLDPSQETSHAHCETMSQALEPHLDAVDWMTQSYILEVSSPGLSDLLTSERDFTVFKGFPVAVEVDPPYKGKSTWFGHLLSREPEVIALSQKGRRIEIPREHVQRVILQEEIQE